MSNEVPIAAAIIGWGLAEMDPPRYLPRTEQKIIVNTTDREDKTRMNREDLHTRVIVFLLQVAMHLGMIALFGWLFHKVGTAHNLFQPDSSFAYGVSAFAGLVVTNVIGSITEPQKPHSRSG